MSTAPLATLTLKRLAELVGFQLSKRGESYNLSPRKIGEIVRSLGFVTHKLGSYGRGLLISKELIRSIHRIARSLGVCRADVLCPEVIDSVMTLCP